MYINPNDYITTNQHHQSMNSGGGLNNHNSIAMNNRGSSFFQNIQDFVRGNSGGGMGFMQNMYLGPVKASHRLSDPEAKLSPTSY